MGVGGAIARSWLAWTQTGLRYPAGACGQLHGSIYRPDGPRHRLCRGRLTRHGDVRLAAGRHERVEGRTNAARLPPSTAVIVEPARQRVARAIPCVQEAVP